MDALSDLAEVNPGGAVSAKVERPTMRIARERFRPDQNNLGTLFMLVAECTFGFPQMM